MKQRNSTADWILLAAVIVHFVVTAIHGAAHARAHVDLSPAGMAFVFGIIFAGPIVGVIAKQLGLARAGATIVAATMAAALLFGLANHFVIQGPDNVGHVAGPSRQLFGATAGLLVITEILGTSAALWCATRMSGRRGSGAVAVAR